MFFWLFVTRKFDMQKKELLFKKDIFERIDRFDRFGRFGRIGRIDRIERIAIW